MVKDAEQMIPRTKTSLDRAIEDLEDLVVSPLPRLDPSHSSLYPTSPESDLSHIPHLTLQILYAIRVSRVLLGTMADTPFPQNALSSDQTIKESKEWQAAFSQLQQIEAGLKADGN